MTKLRTLKLIMYLIYQDIIVIGLGKNINACRVNENFFPSHCKQTDPQLLSIQLLNSDKKLSIFCEDILPGDIYTYSILPP